MLRAGTCGAEAGRAANRTNSSRLHDPGSCGSHRRSSDGSTLSRRGGSAGSDQQVTVGSHRVRASRARGAARCGACGRRGGCRRSSRSGGGRCGNPGRRRGRPRGRTRSAANGSEARAIAPMRQATAPSAQAPSASANRRHRVASASPPSAGITVAAQIGVNSGVAPNAARSSGLILSGGGYRSASQQIALRQSHCGSSYFAIYQMSAGLVQSADRTAWPVDARSRSRHRLQRLQQPRDCVLPVARRQRLTFRLLQPAQ